VGKQGSLSINLSLSSIPIVPQHCLKGLSLEIFRPVFCLYGWDASRLECEPLLVLKLF
jgi:hypothetical protein